jgi:hypothetical protein
MVSVVAVNRADSSRVLRQADRSSTQREIAYQVPTSPRKSQLAIAWVVTMQLRRGVQPPVVRVLLRCVIARWSAFDPAGALHAS